MDSVALKAPAKLNLFLKVIDKRPDGYHTIETLFEKIAIFDNIKLRKIPQGISIYSRERDLPKGKENLAYRAAGLIKDRCSLSSGVSIEIKKSIPIAAGLGGGSSDAACVLMGMNRLYDLGLSKKKLEPLGSILGADVPLFLSDKIWATGKDRGDKIEGIDTEMKLWHILIVPPIFILSKDAYEWVDKKEKNQMRDISNIISAIKKNDIEELGKNLHNDLEGISFERVPRLKGFKANLIEYGARGSLVSGSGPCLFGIVGDRKEAMELKERLRKKRAIEKGWQVLVVPTL